jgi:signal transduction histidine kinase
MSAPRDERTDRLLGVLQKALSHELPNRLIALQGFLQLLDLEETGRLSPDGQDYVKRLSAATQRTAALVKGLADLVRNARTTEVAERFLLTDALREAAAEVKQLAPAAIMEYDFRDAGCSIQLPRTAFRQVVAHLLRNACQAACPERSLHIVVGTRTTAGAVELRVSDNGRGLAAGQLLRLFEPFAGRDAAAAGAGLGLIQVRHVVEGWNGTLHVQSEPDRGSSFSITLPTEAAHD